MDGGEGRWAGSRGDARKKDATAEAVVAAETLEVSVFCVETNGRLKIEARQGQRAW
jgi:hypothetical protein